MALTKVTSGVLGATAVGTANIADNAVGLAQMAHGTDGNLITYDASGAPANVATGTSGHVLTSAGSGQPPVFAAPSASTSYRNGEVIEEVSLICNGESQTVGSGTYTSANVTAAQLMTTTLADLTGSEIAYTPPAGATRVIYKFSFVASYVDAGAIGDFPLFLDSDEVLHARSGTSGYYTEAQHHLEWTFRIGGSADTNTGRVASWGSAKTIKIQAREHTSSYEFKVHETVSWAGVGGSHLSVPRISIKAIA